MIKKLKLFAVPGVASLVLIGYALPVGATTTDYSAELTSTLTTAVGTIAGMIIAGLGVIFGLVAALMGFMFVFRWLKKRIGGAK